MPEIVMYMAAVGRVLAEYCKTFTGHFNHFYGAFYCAWNSMTVQYTWES